MTRLCALYGVTRAGYYAWRRRPVSAHAVQDRQLLGHIRTLFVAHRGRYGSPRVHRALRAAGRRVSRRRPVWVGDITYLPLGRRWRFLAVVLDQASRRVLAWRLGRRRDAYLTRAVLQAAVRRRRPPRGLIFHSDRGTEYVGATFRESLVACGIQQSAARRGPEDNAHMESFFHSLKAELIHGARFATEAALRRYVPYYNRRRLHSALGYRTPVDYEAAAAQHCLRNRGKIPGATTK